MLQLICSCRVLIAVLWDCSSICGFRAMGDRDCTWYHVMNANKKELKFYFALKKKEISIYKSTSLYRRPKCILGCPWLWKYSVGDKLCTCEERELIYGVLARVIQNYSFMVHPHLLGYLFHFFLTRITTFSDLGKDIPKLSLLCFPMIPCKLSPTLSMEWKQLS